MEAGVEMFLQGGAMAMLGYLVVWFTKVGMPKLFAALVGIQGAMDRNTQGMKELEESHHELASKVVELAKDANYLRNNCPLMQGGPPCQHCPSPEQSG